jgi:hypothetical protein
VSFQDEGSRLTQPVHQVTRIEETGDTFDVCPFLEGADSLLEDLLVEVLQLLHHVSILLQLRRSIKHGTTYVVLEAFRYPPTIPIIVNVHIQSILIPLFLFLVQFLQQLCSLLGGNPKSETRWQNSSMSWFFFGRS